MLKIPEEFHDIISKLINLPKNQIEVILQEFKEIKPILDIKQIENDLIDKIKIDQINIHDLLNLSLSLYNVYIYFDLSIDDFLKKLPDALKSLFKEDKPDLQKTKLKNFEYFVKKVVELDKTIGVISKAIDLMRESENLFEKARILTDLRPIFYSNIEETPSGIILHNLKIEYQTSGKRNEFFIALDQKDLTQLENVIKRAITKEKSIRDLCNKTKINILSD